MSRATDMHAATKEFLERPPNPFGDDQASPLNDDTLARYFTKTYSEDLRYVATWGRWLRWNGQRWERDETLHTFDLVRGICRKVAAMTEKSQLATRIGSAQTVAAVERLARADRRHAAGTEQWDRDPWQLNTPGGIVELRSGELRPARREDFCTKATAVAPAGDCPLWNRFLERVTGAKVDLQMFIQRVLGYVLTGITRENALFFLYGLGATGRAFF